MKVLFKGIEYNLSIIGYKNFLYLSGEKLVLDEDIEVDLLPYVFGSINNLRAFKVLSGALKGKVIWT
jgi:hypothetical protein